MLISETAQANEPKRAAIAELFANPWFGVILKNHHGCLMLGQFHGLCQKLVAVLSAGDGWLQHLTCLLYTSYDGRASAFALLQRDKAARPYRLEYVPVVIEKWHQPRRAGLHSGTS